LQRDANHLGRVDDSLGHEIAELAGLGVEAVGIGVILKDLADDNGAVLARIDGDLTRRPPLALLERLAAR
jgi:hypothetical protein